MPRAPTSIRLRPEQEAELAALARDLAAARPDLAAAAHGGELTPGAVLRLAVARGLAELRRDLSAPPPAPAASPSLPADAPADDHARAWPAAPAAPEPPPAAAPEPPRGLVLAVRHEDRGTAYRLTLWRTSTGAVGCAWPDGRRGGWSWGDLSPHAPPPAEWLASTGLPAGDAPAVARALAARWGALTGAPAQPDPPAPGMLPPYREPLR
jgi:hypothetical protein